MAAPASPVPPRCVRSLARLALLLSGLLMQVPLAAGQEPPHPARPELTLVARSRLVEAARDSTLAPWQREFMVEVAQGRPARAATESSPALSGLAQAAAGGAADDGAWSQLTPAGTVPPAWDVHTAIYDPVRDRMVVFGGYDGICDRNDVWSLSLAATPAWSQLAPAGTKPSARQGHTAIYDPVRDRMVVFGGTASGIYVNEVWALSLAGSTAWSALTPAGTPPSGLTLHKAIYDPVRDRMVVFGGTGDSGHRNDVWALSLAGGTAWSALTPAGTPPSARMRHTAIYDPAGDRTVVFGGTDASGYRNDVWALSLAGGTAWSALTPAGAPPSARIIHTAIYDPVRDRMVVFGGWSGALNNDAWALSLAGSLAWSQLAPAGNKPSARWMHTAIYDPVRDRMVVFGGGGPTPATEFLNDVWALTWGDAPTATLASLVSVIAQAARIQLVWYTTDPSGPGVNLYRRTLDSDWTLVDRIVPAGTGYLRYEDKAVTSGTRYGYRLGSMDAGEEVFAGEAWVDVPALHLAMRGATPNPAAGGRLWVEFALRDGSPARLELADVAGRVLSSRQVGSLGPGTHTLDLSEGVALRPGIFFLRLTQGAIEVRARAAVIR